MKTAAIAALISLSAPAALLTLAPPAPETPRAQPSAEAVEQAVALAEARSGRAARSSACAR
jgi:hypothetical protein